LGRGAAFFGTALVVSGATAYRLASLADARHPGHADAAFYYSVARNLRDGRGPVVDYLWNFLVPHGELTHYAFDHWMPLASYAMAGVMWATGASLQGLLRLTVLLGVALAVTVYPLARQLTSTWWVPFAAAAVTVMQPMVSVFAVQVDAAIFFAPLALLAMTTMLVARRRHRLWIVAGVLVALAHLARNDGLLLLLPGAVCALAWAPPGGRVRSPAWFLLGYVCTMTPFFAMNVRQAGTLLPSASAAFPFILDHEDLYRTHLDRSLRALLGGNMQTFLALRADAVAHQVTVWFLAFPPVGAVLTAVLVGVRVARPDVGRGLLSSPWWVPGLFAGTVFLLDAVVIPDAGLDGAWVHVTLSLLPLGIIAALDGLSRLPVRAPTMGLVVLVLILAPLSTFSLTIRDTIAANNAAGEWAAAMAPVLRSEADCLDREIVVMTRSPWEFTEATGIRSIQIPNEPLDEILSMARRYGVTHLQFSPMRAALRDIDILSKPGGQFKAVPRAPEAAHLYRITSSVAGCPGDVEPDVKAEAR
jgi:hypothetical protein